MAVARIPDPGLSAASPTRGRTAHISLEHVEDRDVVVREARDDGAPYARLVGGELAGHDLAADVDGDDAGIVDGKDVMPRVVLRVLELRRCSMTGCELTGRMAGRTSRSLDERPMTLDRIFAFIKVP